MDESHLPKVSCKLPKPIQVSSLQASRNTAGHQTQQQQDAQLAVRGRQAKRTPGQGGDDEDAHERRFKRCRPLSPAPSVAGELPIRLLACPFNKSNPQRYSDRNNREMEYRGCSSCYITSIPRLK